MDYFKLLPKDILRLIVKEYIRPLDYHRLLRVSKLFHILTNQERIEKEVQRKIDQRKSSQTVSRYRRICEICYHDIAKKKKKRHSAEKCIFMINNKNKNTNQFRDHLKAFLVTCECRKTTNFYFPEMAKHRETCRIGNVENFIIGYPFGSPYANAKIKWMSRLDAQERNRKYKELERQRVIRDNNK